MQYYRLLGLNQGAGPDEIKNAFRSRIKECHPDKVPGDGEKARRIIEAYRGLLKGETGPEPVAAPVRPSPPPRPQGPTIRVHAKSRSHAAGVEAGRRIFRSVFRGHDLAGSVENFWDAVERHVLEEGEETEVYGKHVHVREVPWEQRLGGNGITNPKAREIFERAEVALREVVAKYDAQKQRSRRQWSKDYIFNLAQVQVLFRDAMNRHPSLTGRALSRLQQIHELIGEIRKMMV